MPDAPVALFYVWLVLTLVPHGVRGECTPRASWGALASTTCGMLSYPAHHTSDFRQPTLKSQSLMPRMEATGVLANNCKVSFLRAVCTANIPACTDKGEQLLACYEICSNLHLACGAVLLVAQRTDPTLVDELRCDRLAGKSAQCGGFKHGAPCLTARQSSGDGLPRSGGGIPSPPSSCAANDTEEALFAEAITAPSYQYSVGGREYSVAIWPTCVVVGLGLSLLFVAFGKTGSADSHPFRRRLISIRFCMQLITILLVALASMAVFFVSTRQAEEDLLLSFDKAHETQEATFRAAKSQVREIAEILLEETAKTVSGRVTDNLAIFSQSHIESVLQVTRKGGTAADVLTASLASIRATDLVNAVSLAAAVVHANGSRTVVIDGDRAFLYVDFSPNPPTAHIGFVDNVPATFTTDGTRLQEKPDAPWAGAINRSHPAYHPEAENKPLWSGLWAPFGQLAIDLCITHTTTQGTAFTATRTMTLRHISDLLRSSVRFKDQRILVLDTTGGVVGASHGDLVFHGRPINVVHSSDQVGTSIVKKLSANKTLAEVPVNRLLEETDSLGRKYFVWLRRLSSLNLEAISVVMVPAFALEGGMAITTLQLRKNLEAGLQQALDNEEEGHRFLVFVSILINFFALLLSFVASIVTTGALYSVMKDLQDVTLLRLDDVSKRHKKKQPAKLLEVRELQEHMHRTVRQLNEYRRYLPSMVARSAQVDDSSSSDDGSLGSGSVKLLQIMERTCTVKVTYISRRLLGKRSVKNQVHKATKRTSTFEWHYNDPSKAQISDLLKECRAAVGEPPGEPLDLTVLLPRSELIGREDEEEYDEYPLIDSQHLQDVLFMSPEELNIQCKKASRTNLLAPMAAVASVAGKVGLATMVFRMYWSGTEGSRLAVVLVVTLAISFSLNILWSFKLSRKATAEDEHMRDWTAHFQTETTLVMVLCGFNIQNMLVLWCGLRLGKLLRFHAPMPRRIRHQAIRWSMFSLVVGDILPLLVTLFYLGETGGWSRDIVAGITIVMQLLAITTSSVKKFVVFCLVDDDRKDDEEREKQAVRRAKAKHSALHVAELTLLRFQLTNFDHLAETLPASQITRVLNAFYKTTMQAVRHHKGTVLNFADGWLEAAYNYPLPSRDHERLACASALDVMVTPIPDVVKGISMIGERWVVASVVTGEVLKANLGCMGRKTFHHIGHLATLSRSLCGHNHTIQTSVLVNEGVPTRLRRRHHQSKDFLVRPIDIVTVTGSKLPETVFELVPLINVSPRFGLALAGNVAVINHAFDYIKRNDHARASELIAHYGNEVMHVDVVDTAILNLAMRVKRPVFISSLCDCGQSAGAGPAPPTPKHGFLDSNPTNPTVRSPLSAHTCNDSDNNNSDESSSRRRFCSPRSPLSEVPPPGTKVMVRTDGMVTRGTVTGRRGEYAVVSLARPVNGRKEYCLLPRSLYPAGFLAPITSLCDSPHTTPSHRTKSTPLQSDPDHPTPTFPVVSRDKYETVSSPDSAAPYVPYRTGETSPHAATLPAHSHPTTPLVAEARSVPPSPSHESFDRESRIISAAASKLGVTTPVTTPKGPVPPPRSRGRRRGNIPSLRLAGGPRLVPSGDREMTEVSFSSST